MPGYVIHDDVWNALREYRVPDTLGFGLVAAPVMYSATFEKGQWSRDNCCPMAR